MTVTIVKVPSTWMVLLPGNRWVNLALIADVQMSDKACQAFVTWASGESDIFLGEQAVQLVEALAESRNAIEERVSKILNP
ncbi:hypothetical protein [Oscillatoria acuminata]|uniref:Uncharacterized protein n=1 Tax=Oscillatoria acuminata PCC 6304 TaxID=56110 RepID=K9TGI0_9CYAN|nr:hypothetical protein [Oscillatoria acuminata]AFY81236.1 hypothetical protein Oscil6304_1531 [Oscillatoria acuminata PCC 6304]